MGCDESEGRGVRLFKENGRMSFYKTRCKTYTLKYLFRC